MEFKRALNYLIEGEDIFVPGEDFHLSWNKNKRTVMLTEGNKASVDVKDLPDFLVFLNIMSLSNWEIKMKEKEKEGGVVFWWEEVNFEPNQPKVIRKGDKGENVKLLQEELNKVGYKLTTDGDFGPGTEKAIMDFQKKKGLVVDGIVGEKTATLLRGGHASYFLTERDIELAAAELNVHPAAIKAVNEVESRGSGFFEPNSPAILFERHIMRRRLITHGLDPRFYIQNSPDIVNTSMGGYLGGMAEYGRLQRAKHIDVDSALESASWGAYQIMGFHWKALGYPSIVEFVKRMKQNEGEHLKAFTQFIKIDPVLSRALRELDWTAFARRYNGPAYEKNSYDIKMAEAYKKHLEQYS